MEQRYITNIEIINFQNHKYTNLNFDEGINIIIGSSDAGKSAILRAINWVFHNEPKDRDFITFDENEAQVTITFNDGTKVTRIKDKNNINSIIVEKNEQKLVFDKIGHKLPPEAINALGNPPIIKIGDKIIPIAYANQMADLFLVDLTPTELPRAISNLSNTDDFENAILLLSKNYRQIDRQCKDITNKINEYIIELQQYENLNEQIKKIDILEQKYQKLNLLNNNIKTINKLYQEYQNIINKICNITNNINIYEQIIKYTNIYLKLKSYYETLTQINKIINLYNNTCNKINTLISHINTFKNIIIYKDKYNELKDKYVYLCKIHQIIKEYNKIILIENNYKVYIDKLQCIFNCSNKLNKYKNYFITLQKIHQILQNYKAIKNEEAQIKSQIKFCENQITELTKNKNNILQLMKEKGMWCKYCNQPLIYNHKLEQHNE